eukprot:3710358-Pyramimonas_sp.AAC.1
MKGAQELRKVMRTLKLGVTRAENCARASRGQAQSQPSERRPLGACSDRASCANDELGRARALRRRK